MADFELISSSKSFNTWLVLLANNCFSVMAENPGLIIQNYLAALQKLRSIIMNINDIRHTQPEAPQSLHCAEIYYGINF